MKRISSYVLFLVSLTLSLSGVVRAQSSQGRISGSVTDTSGAVIPGAKVTIENTMTQMKRELLTNSAGEYDASGLEPGVYSVTASAPNFQTALRERLQIEVSIAVRADFALAPGQVTQVVEVNATTPLTDTSDSTLEGVLSNKAIEELPVQGR